MLTKSGYYDKTATVIVVLNQVAYVSESLDAKTGEPTPTSKPSIQAFEAIFTIAELLAVAYLWRRRGGNNRDAPLF
jgi:hypothetical protein